MAQDAEEQYEEVPVGLAAGAARFPSRVRAVCPALAGLGSHREVLAQVESCIDLRAAALRAVPVFAGI